MSYSLSFSEEFWSAVNCTPMTPGKPRTIFEALEEMPEDEWEEMCNHLFPKVHYECIDIEDVMERIRATDTCSNLDSPVEVWVDEEGLYRIWVYDDV